MANQFRAMHGTEVLTWSDFYYGPSEYDRLRHRLETDAPTRPLACTEAPGGIVKSCGWRFLS